MSILIKMEMPQICTECPIYDSEYLRCNITKTEPWQGHEDDDVVPIPSDCPLIEQKTGKWIDKWYCSNMSGYEYAMNCSECGKPTYRISFAESMPNYCPNCGADMRGEKDG